MDSILPPTPAATPARPLLAWQSRRVREYIDAHIGTRILISDLSDAARRSEAHFARGFKQAFGQTPHSYVMRRRIEFACRSMCAGEDSLGDIAAACGFTDQAHFCRLFRRYVGQSPGAWRRGRCELRERCDESLSGPLRCEIALGFKGNLVPLLPCLDSPGVLGARHGQAA
jgi:AraC-like DNA-binding protein